MQRLIPTFSRLIYSRAQTSLIHGLHMASIEPTITDAQVHTFLTKLVLDIEDPINFLSALVMYLLITREDGLVLRCAMQMLQTLVPDLRLKKYMTLGTNLPSHSGYRQLIGAMVSIGADLDIRDTDDLNLLCAVMLHESHPKMNGKDPEKTVKILSALVDLGRDVHSRDIFGSTPSKYARWNDLWDEWCEALQMSGLNIEQVTAEEHNEWLLEDDWYQIGQKKGSGCWK